MSEAIQIAASGLAVVTAFLYVLGGLIVNIHLSKYKIIEYQIVSVHYLVAGVVFLLNLIWTLFQGFIPAFVVGLSTIAINQQVLSFPLSVLLGISIFACLVLILPDNIQPRWISNVLKRVRSRPRILRLAILFYPFVVILRSSFSFLVRTADKQDTSTAGSMLIVAIVVLTIDYAWRVYGAPLDEWDERLGIGIGRGIPQRVQLAGDQKDIHLLSLIGVPLVNSELTDEIYLLAETSNHYIIRIIDEHGEAVRIRKEIVSAMQHKRINPQSDKSNSDKPWQVNS